MSPKRKSELSGYLDRYDREHSKIDQDHPEGNEDVRQVALDPSDPQPIDEDPASGEGNAKKPMRHAKAKATLISVATAIFLSVVYIAIGFGVCAGVPNVTELLANATVNESSSPFTKAELVSGAEAVRDYSFGEHDQEKLLAVIQGINDEAGTPYANVEMNELLSAPASYSLGEEEISHLDDVYDAASQMFFPILGTATLAAFLLMVGLQFFGVEVVRRSFLYSGIATIAIFALLGAWALVSFDSLFAVFHSLFFANGSWTFPADSLLITMLPASFWIGMASVWFAVTVIVSTISVLLGLYIGRRRQRVRMIADHIEPSDNHS